MPMETNTDSSTGQNTCCGGPAPDNIDACCVKDADAKAAGEPGCGCNDAQAETTAIQPKQQCCS